MIPVIIIFPDKWQQFAVLSVIPIAIIGLLCGLAGRKSIIGITSLLIIGIFGFLGGSAYCYYDWKEEAELKEKEVEKWHEENIINQNAKEENIRQRMKDAEIVRQQILAEKQLAEKQATMEAMQLGERSG